MDRIYRSSGLMRDKWDRKQSGSTYGAITLNCAVAGCQSFYQPQEQDDYSISIKNLSPATAQTLLPMHTLDDTGNAERMNDAYGKYLRYNYTDKRWMYYKDGKWHYDDRGMVYVAADGVLERMKQELKTWTEHEGGSMLQDYQKHMKKTRSNASKRAMVKEFEHIVSISPADLDTNKTLVNSRSGILDLTTGRISPHNSELYMTRMLGTSMPVNPKNPVLWLRFLDDIFDGDKELIRYVQKSLGYSLSGLTSEQCVFFLYGSGRNGKSTFLEVVRAILGEYATNIQPESIMVKNNNSTANTDIARLKGSRLVTSVEPNEGMRLNEGLLKQLTGDDMITARKLYGDEFEYRPEFKLWVATNHKPTIRGTDLGIWRRIHLIPFTVTISDGKVDKNLGEKLTEELPDILAWMMEGYRLWHYEGLVKPKAVEDAVKDYQSEMDVISAFLNSDYITSGGEVKSSVLYAVYCKWAAESNEYKMPSRKFGIEIGKKFTKRKSNGCMIYSGLSISGVSIGVSEYKGLYSSIYYFS
jgi:putative DNA primase/helicase